MSFENFAYILRRDENRAAEFVGRVTYRDAYGNPRTTDFHFISDNYGDDTVRFLPATEGNDYT